MRPELSDDGQAHMLPGIVLKQATVALAHFGGNLFVLLLMMIQPDQNLEPPAKASAFLDAACMASDIFGLSARSSIGGVSGL